MEDNLETTTCPNCGFQWHWVKDDKENEMETLIEECVMKPLFAKDNLRLWKETDGNYHATNADGNIIWISKELAEGFANSLLSDVTKHEEKPVDTIKGRCLWNDIHIEIVELDGFDDAFMLASISNPERYVFVTDKQLAECNKAAQEREPEIKACPFCGGECILRNHIEYKKPYSVGCMECTYSSCGCETSEEAVRLHNLIAGK